MVFYEADWEIKCSDFPFATRALEIRRLCLYDCQITSRSFNVTIGGRLKSTKALVDDGTKKMAIPAAPWEITYSFVDGIKSAQR